MPVAVRKIPADEAALWPAPARPRAQLECELAQLHALLDQRECLLQAAYAEITDLLVENKRLRAELYDAREAVADYRSWRCAGCKSDAFARSRRDPERCIRCAR